MKTNPILLAIQKQTPQNYETIERVYDITKSYDLILPINDIASKYHLDINELALCFWKKL